MDLFKDDIEALATERCIITFYGAPKLSAVMYFGFRVKLFYVEVSK